MEKCSIRCDNCAVVIFGTKFVCDQLIAKAMEMQNEDVPDIQPEVAVFAAGSMWKKVLAKVAADYLLIECILCAGW